MLNLVVEWFDGEAGEAIVNGKQVALFANKPPFSCVSSFLVTEELSRELYALTGDFHWVPKRYQGDDWDKSLNVIPSGQELYYASI